MNFKLLPPEDLGARLVELREARGWKQGDFARRLGKTQPEVSRWENGKVAAGYDTVAMFAAALDVDMREFMEEAPEAGAADDHGPDAWSDPFIEVMLREARAAEKRAEAAASWARWLELEARNRAGAHEMMREQRRAMRAQVIPSTPPGEEEESRSA